jgi:hypothetical protein
MIKLGNFRGANQSGMSFGGKREVGGNVKD